MDDKHIVAQARRGELSAFEELVTRYEKRVYAIALRSSGSPEDAADITQEVFLRAWRSIHFFFNDTASAAIYSLSLLDAFPVWPCRRLSLPPTQPLVQRNANCRFRIRLHLPKNTWRTASWDASLPPRSMR